MLRLLASLVERGIQYEELDKGLMFLAHVLDEASHIDMHVCFPSLFLLSLSLSLAFRSAH